MNISGTRLFFICIGAGIAVLAGYKVCTAVGYAIETGTVLLGDTRPSLPGRRGLVFPYAIGEAWSYFVGWAGIGMGGILFTIASSRRLWPAFAALPAFVIGFILIAAAPMLGSIAGLAALLGVLVCATIFAIVGAFWLSAREHRRIDRLPGE